MRWYDGWPGKWEDITKCIVQTESWGLQCIRYRGHGPDGKYCLRHAKMIEAGKQVDVPPDQKETP